MGVAAGAEEDADGSDWATAEAMMTNEERRDHECIIPIESTGRAGVRQNLHKETFTFQCVPFIQ